MQCHYKRIRILGFSVSFGSPGPQSLVLGSTIYTYPLRRWWFWQLSTTQTTANFHAGCHDLILLLCLQLLHYSPLWISFDTNQYPWQKRGSCGRNLMVSVWDPFGVGAYNNQFMLLLINMICDSKNSKVRNICTRWFLNEVHITLNLSLNRVWLYTYQHILLLVSHLFGMKLKK